MGRGSHLGSSRHLPVYVAIAVLSIVVSLVVIYGAKSDGMLGRDVSDRDGLDVSPAVETIPIGYEYQWEDGDLQGDYPEELAAAYVLLRANGYDDVSKGSLASLPEDDDALTVSESLNRIVNGMSASSEVAVPISGQNLLFIPAPSMVWTDDGGDVHPVVFLYADEATVTVSDPREGVVEHPFSTFSKMYDSAGRQCIYIADRGYSTY